MVKGLDILIILLNIYFFGNYSSHFTFYSFIIIKKDFLFKEKTIVISFESDKKKVIRFASICNSFCIIGKQF